MDKVGRKTKEGQKKKGLPGGSFRCGDGFIGQNAYEKRTGGALFRSVRILYYQRFGGSILDIMHICPLTTDEMVCVREKERVL
jgi:hypothetical protein